MYIAKKNKIIKYEKNTDRIIDNKVKLNYDIIVYFKRKKQVKR